MENNYSNRAVKGAWILAIASFVSEFLSAVYRIPLQNIVGDQGYFIYQQVYPIYGIFTVLSLTGLPVVLSKVYADQDDERSKRRLFFRLFWILTIISVFITAILVVFSDQISLLMGDIGLTNEVKIVSLAFLLVPLESNLRAYFQSDLLMQPSAISQVIEQIVRVFIIIVSAIIFGKGTINLYQMGTLANSGAFFGGIASIFILLITYIYFSRIKNEEETKKTKPLVISKGLVFEIVLIVTFTGITIFYQLIDTFTMIHQLKLFGFSLYDAEVQKGIFDRAQPILQLGIVISLSFVSSIMPQLRRSNNNRQIISRMVRVCIWLSFAETAGLLALMPVINTMLFKDSRGSITIGVYLLSIILISLINLIVVISSEDKSQNLSKLSAFGVSIFIKIGLNIFLVSRFGIIGAAISTVASELILLIWIFISYQKTTTNSLLSIKFISKVFVTSLIMGIFVEIISLVMMKLLDLTRLSGILICIVSIPVGVILYFVITKYWKVLDVNEWQILPKGKFITRIMKIEDK
ncbi:putative polysaccharide biosynthesis protein [Companilactobacillus metriopterae]|uniref:putative polysaccharide biosynthesis protein n=1 Tax=Companilactobacillus metriopterae TaxID=1909267 RepID=UPI00100A7EA3|nr:oligosaccharide flippase family protein [Companilactobacillus metriopterae]